MPIKERDIVLQGRDGGEDTIDLPITRLGNVESGAEVKAEPAQGDYIPLIDSADNEQMKKFPAQWLLDYKPGAWGTGRVCTLDLERSRIGGKLFTAYTGETPLSEEEGDVELKLQVSDRFLRKEETGELTLTEVELWAAAEASGVPRAFLQIEGREETWAGKSWDERNARWGEIPLTLDYDASGKRGLLRFKVTAEDGKTETKYVVLVELVSGNCEIKRVKYTGADFAAELQYEEDGTTPLTLGAEEAEERYALMGEIAARHDPALSLTNPVALTEWERDRYWDADGKPIRRRVYKGWLPNSNNNGILSAVLPVKVTAEKITSIAYIYRAGAATPTKPSAKPYNEVRNTFLSGPTRANSFTKPLIALRDTEDWDKVCVRAYFQVQAEDGAMTYGVLELYNARTGNYKLGRVELDGDGTLRKDPRAIPVETGTNQQYGEREVEVKRENWNGARLKELGSAVDREKDRFAVWAYDKELPFQEELLPNAVVQAGSWAETSRTRTETGEDGTVTEVEIGNESIDAEHAAPIRFTAWVSPESEKAAIYARTEDPRSWISACADGEDLSFTKYCQKTMKTSTEVTDVYDENDPTIKKEIITRYYGCLAELDQTAAAGEICATVALHVKSQDEPNGNQNHRNSGRIYYIDLKKGYAARELTGVEALGTDMTGQTAGTIDQTAMTAAAATQKGWSWVKLTAPAAETGEEAPVIHVLRPDGQGQFVRNEKCLMTVYETKAGENAPDLEKPLKRAAGVCWAKLFCPGTYRVIVTSQNGLWDKWGKEYTMTLTEQTEAGA